MMMLAIAVAPRPSLPALSSRAGLRKVFAAARE
jgi:hypothetical protein